jgi:hypothetical protein
VTNNWPTWTVRYWYDTLRLRPDELRLVGREQNRPAVVVDTAHNGRTPGGGGVRVFGRPAHLATPSPPNN